MKNRRKVALLRTKRILFSFVALLSISNAQQLNVISVLPTFNEITSDKHPQIMVKFSESVDTSSLTGINFAVLGERSGYSKGTISYDSAQNKATFLPSKDFIAGEQVTVSLARGIHTLSGDSLGGFTWVFRIPSKPVGINFSEPVSYGGGGNGMQCIDMNNDGYPDIVTSSGVILLNNGKGLFNSSWTLPDIDPFYELVVDDFNRDAIMDVLFTGNDGLKIGLGDGMGNFSILTAPFWLYGYITADFNNDGYPDIAGFNVINDTTSYWAIAFNNGVGQFSDTTWMGMIGGWFKKMIATDLDNDGDLDMVVISQYALNPEGIHGFEGIIVFQNNGAIKFPELNFYHPYVVNVAFPEHLNIADFDNDGYSDVAVLGDMSGYICLNSGNGTLGLDTSSIRRFWGAEALAPFALGDINGDKSIDILISGYKFPPEMPITYYAAMPNQGSYFRNYFRDTLPNVLILANGIADLDADGDMDLVHSGEGVFINFNKDTVTSVKNYTEQLKDFSLQQNYPNPFNGETVISFRLSEKQKLTMKIYDMLGKEVKTLKDETISMGEHKVVWDGRDNYNIILPSGIYFIRLQTNIAQKIIKAVLIK